MTASFPPFDTQIKILYIKKPNPDKPEPNILPLCARNCSLVPNRYDNYTITSTALDIAIEELNAKKGTSLLQKDSLETVFIPFLFDLIELQYNTLSSFEKADFQHEINNVFDRNEAPWLLFDGRMIKIDAIQFELDLRQKALEKLQEMKDCEPKFQSAYG